MKKLLVLLLTTSIILSMFSTVVNAEKVEGFSEKIDSMMMENNFSQEQINEIDKQYLDDFTYGFWNEYLPATKIAGKMITDSDEEEYEYILNRDCPDYSYGVLITPMDFKKYKEQYVNYSVLKYLFNSSDEYWLCLSKSGYGNGTAFTKSGTYLKIFDQVTLTKEIIDFMKNKDKLENLLAKQKLNKIEDMRLIAINRLWVILYINCQNKEYGIVLSYLDGSSIDIKPKFEIHKLYELSEIFDLYEEGNMEKYGERYTLPVTKPTYETEAQSLYTDGLLKGNENGLDLLKPLTRIEATAILVRAMGFENEQTSENSYFSDIASDNWGAKYANIAKDKGISEGIGNNMFAPDDTITASQFVTLILRNLGESPDWQTAVNLFVERGLITQEQADKMDLFTRGDMAKIIYEARRNGMFKS